MNKQANKSISEQDNASILEEALRQWVEVCMLHLEHSQKLADSNKDKELDHARK